MGGLGFAREGYQSEAVDDVTARTGAARGQVLSFTLKGELAYEQQDDEIGLTFARHAKKWRRDKASLLANR
jgi:hypothetical protein